MDYSKFYLKNYEPEKEVSDENERVIFPQIESHKQPEIIYINPDGEEFDPADKNKLISDFGYPLKEDNDADVDKEKYGLADADEHEIPVSRPEINDKADKKQSFAARFCQAVLIFAIIVMTLIVSADFISDGKAIAAIADLANGNVEKYYAVLCNPKDNMDNVEIDAYAMRLKGGAGFAVKNGEKYYIVYDVYRNLSDAEDCVKENGGEILTLERDNYDDVEGELKNYTDYPHKTVKELGDVLEELTSKKITTSEAIEKLKDVRENFAVTYENMNGVAATDNDEASLRLLANASVAMSALDYLLDLTVSRPNLACDIRYTMCRILFVYYYSK